MADIAEKAMNIPVGAGCVREFLLGLLLGGFLLLLAVFFAGPQCGDSQGGASEFFTRGISETNNTTTIIQGPGGDILALHPDEPGERTLYTDDSGKSRDVTCYSALYCVPGCPECDETCDECVQENERCGYGASTLTALTANQEFYGRCCEGMACVDGYCKTEQCVENGRFCGYGPTKLSTMVANNPTYYGDCCGNSQCIDGYCTPPEEQCRPEGDSCGYMQTTVAAVAPNATFQGTCCGELVCMDGVCIERTDECNERGTFCGYGPTATFTNYQTPAYYGECCNDDQCLNGYCTPPSQTCVKTGNACGYGQQYATTGAPTNYYGTCCEGDTCVNGVCTPETGCLEQGETCAAGQLACCQGLMCSDNRCVTQCRETGDKCDYDNDCCEGHCSEGYCSTQCMEKVGSSCWPGVRDCCENMICTNGKCVVPCNKDGEKCDEDGDCCSGECADGYCMEEEQDCLTAGEKCTGNTACCDGYYCSDDGYCASQTSQTGSCTDSDGSNSYNAGYVMGYLEGDYGTYEDYCISDTKVVEYTCSAVADMVAATVVTCPGACSGGACLQ